MSNIIVQVTGASPMLMHNARLSNPLDPYAKAMKEITGKRKKTDSDHIEISFREWLGGLYLHPDTGQPGVPGECIKACWVSGGKKAKLGKDLGVALICPDFYVLDGCPEYKDDWRKEGYARKLFERGDFTDVRSVRNQRNRVMRTRPIFRNWSFVAEVELDDEIVNVEQAIQSLETAGHRCGLNDYRPDCGGPFGRFTVEALTSAKAA